MSKLERVIYELERWEYRLSPEGDAGSADQRVRLWITLIFLLCVLSLPTTALSRLLLYFAYPIISSFCVGMPYSTLLRRSLIVLPYLILIGMFNPWIDRRPFMEIAGCSVTYGWMSFVAILLRGLLSAQGVLLLLYGSGYHGVCQSLREAGVPAMLVGQLHLIYRYLKALLQEALLMIRARQSRSYDRSNYPLKMWVPFIGQLLLHTLTQSQQINNAMLARGFTGDIPYGKNRSMRLSSIFYLLIWGGLLVIIRFYPSTLLLP